MPQAHSEGFLCKPEKERPICNSGKLCSKPVILCSVSWAFVGFYTTIRLFFFFFQRGKGQEEEELGEGEEKKENTVVASRECV